jgi:hypothetical protein
MLRSTIEDRTSSEMMISLLTMKAMVIKTMAAKFGMQMMMALKVSEKRSGNSPKTIRQSTLLCLTTL